MKRFAGLHRKPFPTVSFTTTATKVSLASPFNPASFTACFWIYPTTLSTSKVLFSIDDAATHQVDIEMSSASNVTAGCENGQSGTLVALAANQWSFLAVVSGPGTLTTGYAKATPQSAMVTANVAAITGGTTGTTISLNGDGVADLGVIAQYAGLKMWPFTMTESQLVQEATQLAPVNRGAWVYLPIRNIAQAFFDEASGKRWTSAGTLAFGLPTLILPVPEERNPRGREWVYVKSGATAYTGSISESITAPSDAVVRAFVGARALSESISVSDAIARAQVLARALSESGGAPSDALVRQVVESRAIPESATAPSDAAARAFIGARAIGDSIGAPTDAAARATVEARALTESITAPADAVAVVRGVARAIAEAAASPSDAIGRAFAGARAIAESISVADAVSRAFVGARAIAEAASSPTDAVSRLAVYLRAIAESIGPPSDAVVRVLGQARAVTESVPAPSDAVARALASLRSVAESIAVASDAPARAYSGIRGIGESIQSPTDSVSQSSTGGSTRSIPESIAAPSDLVARVFAAARSLAEAGGAPSDAVSQARTVSRALSEAIGGAFDVLARAWDGARALVESIIAPSDVVTGIHGQGPGDLRLTPSSAPLLSLSASSEKLLDLTESSQPLVSVSASSTPLLGLSATSTSLVTLTPQGPPMLELLPGSSRRFSVRADVLGVDTTLGGTLTLTLKPPVNAPDSPIVDSAPVLDATGMYHSDQVIPLSATPGIWELDWLAQGVSPSENGHVQQSFRVLRPR